MSENKCPNGFVFGADWDEYDLCCTCPDKIEDPCCTEYKRLTKIKKELASNQNDGAEF